MRRVAILDELTAVTGWHRKHAVRALRANPCRRAWCAFGKARGGAPSLSLWLPPPCIVSKASRDDGLHYGEKVLRALLEFTAKRILTRLRLRLPMIATYRFDGTATGYVLGAGVEFKINPRLSLKGEYQYTNLGTNDPTNSAGHPFSNFMGGGIATVRDDAYHTFPSRI